MTFKTVMPRRRYFFRRRLHRSNLARLTSLLQSLRGEGRANTSHVSCKFQPVEVLSSSLLLSCSFGQSGLLAKSNVSSMAEAVLTFNASQNNGSQNWRKSHAAWASVPGKKRRLPRNRFGSLGIGDVKETSWPSPRRFQACFALRRCFS